MVEMGTPAVADRPREPAGSWGTLFGLSADPIFFLSRRRQIRYANRAWESLTGKSFDALRGSFCLPRKKKGTGPLRALLQTLAPPPEVMEGLHATVRRPVPPHRLGPPWWEIIFVPLRDESGLTGILGQIRPIAAPTGTDAAPALTEALIGLRQRAVAQASFDLLESEETVMQRVETQARLAASLKTPLWIVGEAGTGKETLARVVHFNGVTREQTFLGIDCAGLQPFLIRNMLFGLAGQAGARLGTVFLKNPETLPGDLQSELIQWCEEQEDPPRIAIGSRDLLGARTKDNRLLPEWITTFNVIEIQLPALRHRLGDMPRLVAKLLRRESADAASPCQLASDALERLSRHSWPGNLRELTDVLRGCIKSSEGGRIEASHLPLFLRGPSAAPANKKAPKLDDVLDTVETRLIRQALQKSKGNKSEAADLLGMPRARLLRRIEQLKIGVME